MHGNFAEAALSTVALGQGEATSTLPPLQMTSEDASSNYGSDIDVLTPVASDYGSDFDAEEETLILSLLQRAAAPVPSEQTVIYPSIGEDDDSGPTVLIHSSPPSAVVRLQKGAAVELETRPTEQIAPAEEDRDEPSTRSGSEPQDRPITEPNSDSGIPKTEPVPVPSDSDVTGAIQSPLQRFRTKPKKPLSVTDLVSPAWCELQYWYVLTKFGRKPQTLAMKRGSKVHRVLEEQVHEIVPVETKSKEDRFGLKLWNTIQGLRSLRQTGLTRELEIWGIIDGQVVNGIIDELSYTCPDQELEASLNKSRREKSGGKLPDGQQSISHCFATAEREANPWLGALEPDRIVYLADVKTRGAKSVPAAASLRPTWMQLMLYRKLLESLARNNVDADTVFTRYSLQPLLPFTEIFLAEIQRLDGRVDLSMEEEGSLATPHQSSEIESHNNLSALWSLMVSEFGRTMTTFSDVLRAEFRYSKTGELIGSEVFAYDVAAIEAYISKEMSWWKGEREAVGVEIEEAFKCRSCDFAEECTWRRTKIEEATEKHRLRVAARAKSAV